MSKHFEPMFAEFKKGHELVGTIPRHVTIFGSARTKENSHDFKSAYDLGWQLASKGHNVATGAGDCGQMLAGNKGAWDGAREAKTKSLSIGYSIELETEQKANEYCDLLLECKYFNSRKWFLISRASAIIATPGGIGTLEEIFDVWTKVQCSKIKRKLPIVLFDSSYWNGCIDWMRNVVCKRGYISKEDLDLVHISDSVDDTVRYIESH